MRLQTALPSFYAELDAAMLDHEEADVRQQLASLEITGRCECDQLDCATFHVAPSRMLNAVEQNVIGVRHGRSIPLDSVPGLVVVDVDNFGRVTTIEVLDRPDVSTELTRLRVPGGRTRS